MIVMLMDYSLTEKRDRYFILYSFAVVMKRKSLKYKAWNELRIYKYPKLYTGSKNRVRGRSDIRWTELDKTTKTSIRFPLTLGITLHFENSFNQHLPPQDATSRTVHPVGQEGTHCTLKPVSYKSYSHYMCMLHVFLWNDVTHKQYLSVHCSINMQIRFQAMKSCIVR